MGCENMHAPPLRRDVTLRQVHKGFLELVVAGETQIDRRKRS